LAIAASKYYQCFPKINYQYSSAEMCNSTMTPLLFGFQGGGIEVIFAHSLVHRYSCFHRKPIYLNLESGFSDVMLNLGVCVRAMGRKFRNYSLFAVIAEY